MNNSMMGAGIAIGVAATLTFVVLALLHMSWALGLAPIGGAGVPEIGGKPTFVPGRGATLAVAAALLAAAFVVAARSGLLGALSQSRLVGLACGVLGLVFVARAVGEFRLVGFFKTVKGTQFAYWDTMFYSPLCLVLGVCALWLALRRP